MTAAEAPWSIAPEVSQPRNARPAARDARAVAQDGRVARGIDLDTAPLDVRALPRPDAQDVGVFSGAGLSTDPPACLPLGRTFHRLLREVCIAGLKEIAPGSTDPDLIAAARLERRNVLARLDSTLPGAARGAVAAMKVTIPSEAHLLAAVHLARGGLHVTVNFDDGIETAYALLTRRSRLDPRAPQPLHDSLASWQRLIPGPPPRLSVASTPGEIAAAVRGRRPLLVKLHGSLGSRPDGVAIGHGYVSHEPEVIDIGWARQAVLDELARSSFVLVTGFSGSDPATYGPVLHRLRPRAFAWVAPEVRPEVVEDVGSVDPRQPITGHATPALRALLSIDAPGWPSASVPIAPFEDRFQAWARSLPPSVGAEVFAWALSDGGRHGEAIEILERVLVASGRPRTNLRLAAIRLRRGASVDAAASRRDLARTFTLAADRELWRTGLVQSAERFASPPARPDTPHAHPTLARSLPALFVSVLASELSRGAARPAVRRHATTVTCSLLLRLLEERLRPDGREAVRRSLWFGAALGLRLARRTSIATRPWPSGRLSAVLLLQAIELVAVRALLEGRPAPAGSIRAAERIERAFAQLGDERGVVDSVGTRALVLITRGEPTAARILLDRARLHRADSSLGESGVVEFARTLLEAPTQRRLPTPIRSR